MSFRTVVIKERCKLDFKMNYLVCRAEKETKIFIPEITTLILESTAISITTALISELVKNNVKIIFCDEKHNPHSELLAYYASYSGPKRILEQMGWSNKAKSTIWQQITKEKISKQQQFLIELKHRKEAKMLEEYYNNVELNDSTNREGHSAKVYFNAVWGMDFGRRNPSYVNNALNYGYAILLALMNREITKCGYLTQLGIWHSNQFNNFNLSSDLMEPFRVLVDRIVYNIGINDNYKFELLNIFNAKLKIGGKVQDLEKAIEIYCQSVFDALNNNDVRLIKFYEL